MSSIPHDIKSEDLSDSLDTYSHSVKHENTGALYVALAIVFLALVLWGKL